MDLSAINPILLVASLMVAATPILLAAIGELVAEKAGVLNLGVEGMMVVGAISGFAIAVETGSPLLGFIAATIGGALLSLLFVFLTQVVLANQVASGLALTLFGLEIHFEVKAARGRVSDLQRKRIESLTKSGALVFIVRGEVDAANFLQDHFGEIIDYLTARSKETLSIVAGNTGYWLERMETYGSVDYKRVEKKAWES